jgi:hypothetical protein
MPTSTTGHATTSRRTRPEGPRLPYPSELELATARTRAVLQDPASTPADKLRAAEAEAAAVQAYKHSRGSQVQANLEHWLEGHDRDRRGAP